MTFFEILKKTYFGERLQTATFIYCALFDKILTCIKTELWHHLLVSLRWLG